MKSRIIKRIVVFILLITLGVPFSVQFSADTVSAATTEKQYRYHRYVDDKGNVSLCPYYGNWRYDTKMKIEYTEWMSKPLTKDNGKYSTYTHVYQGASCEKAGCVDESCDTNRYVDEDGEYWFYQETRTVEKEVEEKEQTTEVSYKEYVEAVLDATTIGEIEDTVADTLWKMFEITSSVADISDEVLKYAGTLFLEALQDQLAKERLDLADYFKGGKDFALGVRTLNKTVSSADYDAFLDAILAYETVTDDVRQSLYDLLYRAEFRPNQLGGTNNDNYPAPNSPDPDNPLPWSRSLEDEVLGVIKFSHGCRGCMHYANAAMSYVYGDRNKTVTVISPYPDGNCCAKELGDKFTVANVKKVIADAVPGSHVRFNYNNGGVHSVVYLGKDAANEGFYYISFLGGGRSSSNMYVGYTTYEAIVDNGGSYVGVWHVSK